MGTYFLDTSAIVKRYFPEQGHGWIVNLCDPAQGHDLYISQAALVEVVATMCRKAREQSITLAERDALISAFRRDSRTTYNVWLVTDLTYTSAGNLCRFYSLRAYDAVQLACALNLRYDSLAREAPAPVFVCADLNLTNIAMNEGLITEDPNSYPSESLNNPLEK